MFDQMKAMGALAGLLKDKDRLRAKGEEVRARLDEARVVGEACGGAVRVTASGKGEIVEVVIAPALAGDPESAQGYVRDATNDALRLARDVMGREASRAAEELGLPDLPGVGALLGA